MAVVDLVLAAGQAHPLPPLFHHLPANIYNEFNLAKSQTNLLLVEPMIFIEA